MKRFIVRCNVLNTLTNIQEVMTHKVSARTLPLALSCAEELCSGIYKFISIKDYETRSN